MTSWGCGGSQPATQRTRRASDAFQGYQVSIYTFDDTTAAHEYALDQFFGVFHNDTIVVHGGDEFEQALILACGCGEIVATPA